ncbi:hypothetical protein TRFO_26694 [Tritrichomonas foetus]|uniref:Uncharacterized protein n=1 Tax=Tritrichomonas foetus TaxID=1144522 RepID=A0A1J4K767_9EUKA|nr:hypothetical protein TRFO_26694 [Tritrichomonas foetus]|eukprot:OHT05548.1 hypothetical protein TRFO_26694 [Tritrichomonas foetus]
MWVVTSRLRTPYNIQQHQNELDQNFLDSNIIRLVQSQLLKLRGLIFKLKTSLKAIEKCTNDPTCSVLLERLIMSLNSTMCEQMPSIDTSRHLASFIQTQHDLGILINSIYKSMNNPNINSHIRSNMQQSLKISQNSYIEMIKIRRELNETPYDSDTIKQAMIQLTKVHNMLEYFIDYSRQYSEKTLDMELQRCTSVTLRNIKNTIDDLNNAPACIFRVPPSSKDVESLIKIIHELESSYDDNSQMKHSLKKQISKLQNEKLLPSDNFFRIVQRILNKISKIPSSHNQELLSKTINELKLFLNYKKPTLADVKALSLAAIAAYDDFIHNIKSRNDQPCYKSWEVTIQNQINSILTIINNTSSEQFNYQSSLLVKEAFMNIKTQLPYIPNSLRDIIDMQIFENLATKLGKAHAHGNKIINCVRNLPTSSVVKIDIHKFRLIQNDDELDDSFLIWREQVNYLNSIVNECSNMPQIATQIHTQNLLSKIVSTLKNILDMKYSNENEMIKFLGFFKDQMQFMENSINLISPILGSPNLPDICLILSQNAILLHRLLISPHMKENESNAFINEFKICFSSLLNLIPKCNQSVQSHIKDLNTIIFGISNIDTIGLRKRQILCDTLYMHVTTILPKIFNAIDSDEIIDELLKLYEITGRYKSVQTIEIKFTSGLHLNSTLLSDETISNVVQQGINYCNGKFSPELSELIIDNLAFINDHQEIIPEYIYNSSFCILPTISSIKYPMIMTAVRCITSLQRNFSLKLDHLIEISINISIRTGKIVNNIKNTLQYIDQQILSSPHLFNEVALNQFNQLMRSLSYIDTKMLTQCKSLATTVLSFLPMQDFESDLLLFLNSAKDLLSLRSIILPLNDSLSDFCFWLNETELSISSIFLSCMDFLVCQSEEKNETGMMPFFRRATQFLLSKERLFVAHKVELRELSKLFLQYPNMYPNETLSIFEKLLPIIKWWSNLSNNENSLNIFISNSMSINGMLDRCKYLAKTAPTQLIASFSIPKSKITRIIAENDKTNIISEIIKEIEKLLKMNLTLTQIDSIQKCINQILSQSQSMLRNQISKYNLSSIVNQANRDIDLITKKKYVDIANEILNYLKELISRIEAKNSINSTEKKHYIETRYVPILSYGMMSIINTNEKDQTNNILSYDFATLNSILYGTMVNLFSVQKYQLLKLVLSDMFHDTIKSKYIDSKSIKSDDFDFAFMYTEQQFDLVFDKKALNELQSRFTHNDVLIQQYIISCCINSYSSFGEDNINISNQYLLTLFTQIKNGKPIKKISISKYLNYQISVIRLLSQLLSLLLLLPNDSFLRYINTSEGQRHTFSHASSHDILKCQQIIQQLIIVSSFPNVIALTINQLSHEQILLIIKLIIHSIAMIQNGKFENAPDSITIFRALNIQQQKLFKENPEELLSSEYISIQAINDSHQILLDLMKRFIISTSLFSIWFHNKASNDTKEPTDTDIKIEIDLIIKNISSLNIGVNSLLTPDEKEKYANVSLHLLCLLLNHKLLFTNSENIYVPYKSMTHPKMHLVPKSINNIILFDSLLQVFSHIEDSLLMLSFHSKYTKNDIQKENSILLDEFLSILNNTPSKINEFIDAYLSNSLYTSINQEIISCNSNQLTDNITLVANQSNILNKIVICFQQYIDHSFSKFFNKDDIGNLVDKYLLLYKLSSISEILDRFDVKPNHSENIEINKDFIVETIEKQLKIIESTKSQQLYTMMKKMTPNERSNEKFVLILLIKNIKEDTNFVRVNLQKLISKLDLNIESCEITVSQTQYHQYLLAQKLQIILDKTMKGNILDNHHNQDILLTFSQNELHEFYKITRILIGNPNSNIDINFKYLEFLKHAIKILCSDYDILSSHITVPSFSISSYLNITPIPTYYTLLSKYAHSIHSLIHLFSTYSQLPDKECMLILNSENKSAIELMKSQINSEQILPSIHKICDILPQMIASLIVVFDQKQTNDTLKPLSLFSDIETLLESSLGDDKLYDFRKSLLRLQSKFSNLQAITDPEFFSNDKRCIDCVVGLIISIDKMDLKAFNSILIELEAIKTNSVKTGIPNAILEPIWKELHLISPIAISSYGKSFLFDTEMKEKVSKLRPILIDILNKRINNPFTENEKLTSSHNISLLLKECLNNIINGEKTLVKLIGTQFDDSKFSISQAINDIVVHFTSAIASSIKNLEMIKDEKISNYTDFYEILPTAINSLKQLMEIKNDSSPTHTSTRRLIRPLKRVINSLLDQIDDLNDRIPQDYRKNNDITCEKLEYAKNVSDILMKSLLTVATNSSSIIPDTFTEFLKTGNQSEKYHQSILNIQNIGKCLIKLNVDKAAESEFHSEMTHLSDELYKFNSIISSQKQISSDKMIESFTDLALFLMKSFRKSLLLTDIQAESPDFDNAARIPNHYFMPKVPNDSLQFKLQENISKLKLDLDKYKGKSNEFTIAQTSSNNTKLTDIMISLIKIMDSLLENLLRVTATTMSLKYQTSLANNASGISSNFSTIVKSFRNKLLLIGDWSSSYPKYFLIIDNPINDIIMKCEEAYKVAEAEEKTRDMNVIKINKSLKLIKDTEAIPIAQKNPIENIISSNQKEWSIQILNIGLSLSNSFEKVLLHAKENAKKDYQTILSLSDSMCTNISEISKIIANTINNNDRSIEGDINKVMLSIASSANEYGNWKASSKEELAMKNGILIICRAANSVADMVMMASNAKNAAQERKRIASDQQRLLQSTASKDRLLKRLELESKVIKSRIVLAKSEQILADIH